VRELHDAGHKIRVLARDRNSPAAQELTARFGAEIREGNILEAASLPKATHGTDAVIHLVGIITEVGEQTFENVHVRGTDNVILAAVSAGVRRFIHMSALGTRANAVSRYHKTKWAAENALSRSVLDWTVFRPSLIYGPEDKFVNLFAQMAGRWRVLPLLARKEALFQPVPVEEVARCFVGALNEPRSVGQAFDICGPDYLTLRQILETILDMTNRKCRLVQVPIEYSRPLARMTEFFYSKLLKKAPPLNRDQVQMLQEDNLGQNQWTVELFKLEPTHFADGIARYLRDSPAT
jgi:NADH dehydrogenase